MCVCVRCIGKLAVLDVAEVNPDIGSPEDQAKTLDSCNKILSGWFTSRIPQR